jgi:MFS family permease
LAYPQWFLILTPPSEVPSNLVLKRITPKIWLPFLTTLWGIITMCLGFVQNFGSFFAVRAVLGIAEGGLLPGMVLYLSGLYTRGEMALRIGIFYTAASLSGAFGGRRNSVDPFPVSQMLNRFRPPRSWSLGNCSTGSCLRRMALDIYY